MSVWLLRNENELFSGGNDHSGRGLINKYSTASAAIEEPIKPAVNVEHTQLLIDGKFADSVSGEFSFKPCFYLSLTRHGNHVGHKSDVNFENSEI